MCQNVLHESQMSLKETIDLAKKILDKIEK